MFKKYPSLEAKTPFYELYGEPLVNRKPGFIHIENIADRSRGLGWVIKPHRHRRLFQVLCIFNTELEVRIEREIHSLKGSWVLVLPAGTVHGFHFQPNAEGFVLTLDTSTLTDDTAAVQDELNAVQAGPQLIDANIATEHLNQFFQCIELVRTEFHRYQPNRDQALTWITKLAILSLSRQLREQQVNRLSNTADSQVLSKFRELLEAHYREHWPVSKYSTKLHVSTSTLRRLCYQYTGTSPKKIIQERVLTESKRRLLYTRQSLEEIAETLGFKDQAYFSRFFKKLEKITPGTYRKQDDPG